MPTKRLSICSNLVYHQRTVLLPLLSLLSHPVDALAIPPPALRLTRRDDIDPGGDRTTRNEVVAALLTIIVLIILVSWGIERLVTTARRSMVGTVTSSSSSGPGSSVLDMWDSPAVRFMRYATSGAPPGPRIRNDRDTPVIIHVANPQGAGPG